MLKITTAVSKNFLPCMKTNSAHFFVPDKTIYNPIDQQYLDMLKISNAPKKYFHQEKNQTVHTMHS